MARLTLILGVLATVIGLFVDWPGVLRFGVNEWRNWRNKGKKTGTWLSVIVLMLSVAPAYSAELASDTFLVDGGLGANWTTVTGLSNPTIVGGVVQPANIGNPSSIALYTNITWPNDQYATVKIITAATSSGRVPGLVVRGITGARTEYECHLNGPLGATVNLLLVRYNAGASTTLASTGANQTVASGDTLGCQAKDDVVKLLINGVAKLSVVDATPITSGSPGIIAHTSAGATSDTQLDDWAGGSLPDPATLGAASCAYADVKAAVDLSFHGDTVTIPACAQTNWTTQLDVAQGITLQGAGQGVTILGDNVTKNGSATSSLLSFAINTPYSFYITGFTLVGVAADASSFNKGHIVIGGNATTWRIHHITLTDAQTVFLAIFGHAAGLMDHVTGTGVNYQGVKINTALGGSYGDTSWAQALSWGSSAMLYFEDNTFTDTSTAQHGFVDCFGGGRYVSRYNTLVNFDVGGSHGTDSGARLRGCRQIEAYENDASWTFSPVDRGQQTRGGTSVVYNNRITGVGTLSAMVKAVNFRDNNMYIPFGFCGERSITSITRSGSTATATTSAAHGYGNGGAVRVSGANESEYNLSTTISNITATTFDYTVSGTPSTPATGTLVLTSPYDENQGGENGYRCVDQPGAGTSRDLADSGNSSGTTPPSPYDPVANALDPIYVWGNTYNGSSNNTVNTSGSTHVIENRDYYIGTTRPGYTAYTYPHPLQGGGASQVPTPVVIARVLRWMEILMPILGLGFHFRRQIMAVSLAALALCSTVSQLAPRTYITVKSVSKDSAVKVLTVFNHLTKPRI